jgi:hypothetical protein
MVISKLKFGHSGYRVFLGIYRLSLELIKNCYTLESDAEY